MNGLPVMSLVVAALAALLAAGLFILYQNPLMEIYLANWMLC